MSFWSQIKSGFAYGLGGSLGWEAGQVLARLLRRFAKWLLILVAAITWKVSAVMGWLPKQEPQHPKPAVIEKKSAVTSVVPKQEKFLIKKSEFGG